MSSADVVPFTTGVETGNGRGQTFPYMSFNGFRNLGDRLVADGLPQVFDRSFFGDYSGSLIAQTRAALRFFDFIDEDQRPTERLQAFVAMEEPERIQALRDLTEQKYAHVIALGTNATQGQLLDAFREAGLSGDSLTKATTFYLRLAEYVDLPISPFFKRPSSRSSGGNAGAGRRTNRRRKTAAEISTVASLPTSESSSPSSEEKIEEKRLAYIDLLMRLVEQSADKGEVQLQLLDRLESALQINKSSPDQTGE